MMKKTQIIFLLLLATGNFFAQTPFIRNFPPDEYKEESQNLAIIQDQRGVMYFGNQDGGILEYDGVNWRLIKTINTVRSLGSDNTGKIYVGLSGDFGYLQPDSTGNLYYVSLKDKIPVEHNGYNKSSWPIWRGMYKAN